MSKFNVSDISRKVLLDSKYDLAVLCCGYEPRCTFLSEIIDKTNINDVLVYSYSEHADMLHRKSIDSFFVNKFESKNIYRHSSADTQGQFNRLYQWADTIDLKSKDKLRVLIDYSSMTKSLLSIIIFFFLKFIQKDNKIDISIDFSYSVGEYPEIIEHKNFSQPLILQGCEGSPLTFTKKAALFLLGFDSVGPQVINNAINPDKSYGIYASPSAKESYVENVLAFNSEFIDSNLGGKNKLLGLPLTNVTVCFDYLNQIISPLKSDCNISIALFGPKPHVLASILTANYHRNVTCIHCKALDFEPRLVQGIGELVLTRLDFSI
ncbi:hypothetical protein GCM10008107_17370 [Psychrosphaera saromensis]|uniref:SMODS-associated and fused to various effectors domain-containing protein n=1 Tax=Psychrosphaera saromensis TaxID=716813 RepID=A0A2S7UTJ2_9GAMM|nr:hypothetical protein [Psychrosphaera saromensis]PQJ53058.1 hypothetical protein BTO11_04890 [Psychrosphaera saromensis]GHB68422.1 hypothetical protein GCM10008107_17370 [Psychrosphaera saromensis]GLQ15193.1 hypothetical protein GCM10007917_26480 [Psychrosphaera saromensis]